MKLLLPTVLVFLTSCAAQPPVKEPAWAAEHRNACVPEAASMASGLHEAGIEGKVLLIYTPAWNHAVCVFLYPGGRNRLWVWDANWKSIEVRAFYDSPAQIARAWLAATNRGSTTITSARFLE